ncbi:MAG TPA: EAL domain-containing protein [Acidimicrobiia bacterium]|nr:EAL domain-containing protein [Acidimicrobiia bacterium]
MSTALISPHHLRASPNDLIAIARYWEWERTIAHELPRVVSEDDIGVLFQPIYRLRRGQPVARGFEALARFPVAPLIPVGLWFRTASDLMMVKELELAAIRAAFAAAVRLSEDAFFCVNASLVTVPDLIGIIPETLRHRLLIDLPYVSVEDRRAEDLFHALRQGGAGIAIDDVPLDDLHVLRPTLLRLRPDCIKVDVLTGLADSQMARFNLAEGSAWCQQAGINLIAERVERMSDLSVLSSVGVEWAQGYSLSRPVDL